MTGAVAAVTVTGTIYGATLKSEQDIKKVSQHLLSNYVAVHMSFGFDTIKRITSCFLPSSTSTDTNFYSKRKSFYKPPPKNESPNSKSPARILLRKSTRWKGRLLCSMNGEK